MQKSFMINALRTRTKYNLTSIRKGMKEEILQELTGMFGRELRMSMPMVHFEESMRNDYAGAEVCVKLAENVVSETGRNSTGNRSGRKA